MRPGEGSIDIARMDGVGQELPGVVSGKGEAVFPGKSCGVQRVDGGDCQVFGWVFEAGVPVGGIVCGLEDGQRVDMANPQGDTEQLRPSGDAGFFRAKGQQQSQILLLAAGAMLSGDVEHGGTARRKM